MATVNARSRRSSGPGKGQWIALGIAALVILGLTFTLGLLVGRQWARPLPPGGTAQRSCRRGHRAAARAWREADLLPDAHGSTQERGTWREQRTGPSPRSAAQAPGRAGVGARARAAFG